MEAISWYWNQFWSEINSANSLHGISDDSDLQLSLLFNGQMLKVAATTCVINEVLTRWRNAIFRSALYFDSMTPSYLLRYLIYLDQDLLTGIRTANEDSHSIMMRDEVSAVRYYSHLNLDSIPFRKLGSWRVGHHEAEHRCDGARV
jgi:hypothetical protein